MKIQFVIGAQDDCVCNRRVDVGSVEDVDFRKINVVEGLLRADEKEWLWIVISAIYKLSRKWG